MSTRLAGLSLQRFRNLPEFSIELDDGLVLVRGPNEAGKSSLVEAVFFALFRDAGSTAREIAQAITWGLSSRPVVELMLEVDGDEYLLRRDYAAKKNLLRNATTGDEWHDKKTIAAKVAGLLGLETESLGAQHRLRAGRRAAEGGRGGRRPARSSRAEDIGCR